MEKGHELDLYMILKVLKAEEGQTELAIHIQECPAREQAAKSRRTRS